MIGVATDASIWADFPRIVSDWVSSSQSPKAKRRVWNVHACCLCSLPAKSSGEREKEKDKNNRYDTIRYGIVVPLRFIQIGYIDSTTKMIFSPPSASTSSYLPRYDSPMSLHVSLEQIPSAPVCWTLYFARKDNYRRTELAARRAVQGSIYIVRSSSPLIHFTFFTKDSNRWWRYTSRYLIRMRKWMKIFESIKTFLQN